MSESQMSDEEYEKKYLNIGKHCRNCSYCANPFAEDSKFKCRVKTFFVSEGMSDAPCSQMKKVDRQIIKNVDVEICDSDDPQTIWFTFYPRDGGRKRVFVASCDGQLTDDGDYIWFGTASEYNKAGCN